MSGPAFEITTMATHKVFKDLYDLIDSHTSNGQMSEPSAVITIGHSEGLESLINAFEIYRDEGNLTVKNLIQFPNTLAPSQASDWGTGKAQQRKWRISDIGAFASNIGVILYQCSNGAGMKRIFKEGDLVNTEGT